MMKDPLRNLILDSPDPVCLFDVEIELERISAIGNNYAITINEMNAGEIVVLEKGRKFDIIFANLFEPFEPESTPSLEAADLGSSTESISSFDDLRSPSSGRKKKNCNVLLEKNGEQCFESADLVKKLTFERNGANSEDWVCTPVFNKLKIENEAIIRPFRKTFFWQYSDLLLKTRLYVEERLEQYRPWLGIATFEFFGARLVMDKFKLKRKKQAVHFHQFEYGLVKINRSRTKFTFGPIGDNAVYAGKPGDTLTKIENAVKTIRFKYSSESKGYSVKIKGHRSVSGEFTIDESDLCTHRDGFIL